MTKKNGLYNRRDDGCWICHNPYAECHHIYGGFGRRSVSDQEGCYVYLCKAHHNGSNHGVHFDRQLDMFFRRDCQRRWEQREGIDESDHETFISLFGCNYL